MDARKQYEDQKNLNKDILPYFRTIDVSQITKQTINEYLGSLDDRRLTNQLAISTLVSFAKRGGPSCLNRFSASISGASARVRLPSEEAAA